MGAQQTKERTRRPNQLKSDQDLQINTSTFLFQDHGSGSTLKGSTLVQSSKTNQFNDQLLVALYDFVSPSTLEDQSQTRVEKGDHLHLFGYSADGDWADVECLRTNERVWIPTNYTSRMPSHPSDPFINLNTGSTTSAGGSITFQQKNNHDISCNGGGGGAGCGSQGSLAGVGLELEKWYHGAIQRSYAEYLLNSGITGSFLVRESESHPGQLTISLRYEGQIWHYRIHRDEANLYYVIESNKFTSVSDLVRHHEKHSDGLACTLLYPAPKRDRTSSELRMDPGFDVREIDRTEIVMKHKLGSGQYGVVYEAIWKPYNVLVAVKTLKENVTVRDEFLEEARLMKSLRHPNLVTLLGACTREPPYYIVTEFMCNGNLLDYLRTQPRTEMTPSVLLHMATQVARGMAYLEQHNFIHRDLAARNCLVGRQHTIKVADFGLARCIERDLTYRAHEGAKFPIKWTAPEGLVYNIFSTKSDVWAFGVLLWEIATYGKTPYPGVELQDVYVLLERGTRMLRPEGCPEQVYELMLQCWQWHPEQRPPFSDILNQLESMSTNSSIEEQIAMEFAASSASNTNETTGGINSNDAYKLLRRPHNIFPRPPLPPRPPPQRRSTSCDYLVDENAESQSDRIKDDSKSDIGIDGAFHKNSINNNNGNSNHKLLHGSIFTKNLKNPLSSKQLHIDDLSTEDFCSTDKDLSFTTSGSLGRKRTAPRPPRRTTPVKPLNFLTDENATASPLFPINHWDDYTKSDFDHNTPPLPPPPEPIHPPPPPSSSSSSSSNQQSCLNQSQQYPRVTTINNSSNNLTMPSIMSTSAIFPSSGPFSSGDPSSCDNNNLTRSIYPDHPIPTHTTVSSPFTKQCQPSSKSSLPPKSINNSDLVNKITSEIQSRNLTSINHSHSRRIAEANHLPKEGKSPSVHHPTVASTDFQEELRDRLKQHSQQLKDWSASKPGVSKAVSNKSSSGNGSGSAVSNSSPYFTIPRLKTINSANSVGGKATSNTTTTAETSNVTPSTPDNKTEPSQHPTGVIQSETRVEKSTPLPNNNTTTPIPITNRSAVNNTNASPKFHGMKRLENENCHDKLSSLILQKRLSWTGPTDDNSSGSQKRSQRLLCLPTIFSTSSTALDEVSAFSGNHCIPPTKAHLRKHLSYIVDRLEHLISCNVLNSDCSGIIASPMMTTTTTPASTLSSSSASSLSNSEHLIELADQLEACRSSCSTYIDQATCSARAKFNFRDRFACLQTFSSLLRSKKLDITYSNNNNNDSNNNNGNNTPCKNNKTNITLLRDVQNAIREIINDLNKLSEDAVNCSLTNSQTIDPLLSGHNKLNCTENLSITDNSNHNNNKNSNSSSTVRSATVFT
ncbi:unnamed protein product [Trichobilharzia szidati]|nr:unnamed protein product [Trichobilharzia szidati]